MKIKTDETITVMGKKGCGKTTFVKALCAAIPKDRLLVYDPLGQYESLSRYVPARDDIKEFESIAEKVWNKGNMFFVVEEAELYYREMLMLSEFSSKIALRGRNKGIGLMCVTRRPQELKKTALNQSDHIFIFKLEGWDIDYMDGFLRKRFTKELNAMMDWHRDDHCFYHYQDGILKFCPAIKV